MTEENEKAALPESSKSSKTSLDGDKNQQGHCALYITGIVLSAVSFVVTLIINYFSASDPSRSKFCVF